jgi:hypothetical protein
VKGEFILALDEYFCEKYENYDKLCGIDGYKMPKMQTTELRDGRKFSYTLPANTMRLSLQENKEEILARLKERLVDLSASFSFIPLHFFSKIRNKLDPLGFKKVLKNILAKKSITKSELLKELTISEKVWKKVCKGDFLPTKNLILSVALAGNFTYEETVALLNSCEYEWDFTTAKDVVISYLVSQKIFNTDMVWACLEEYNVSNLYLTVKKEENA